jgi:hypothetical protein
MTKLLKKPVGFVLTQTLNVPKIVRFRLSLAAAFPTVFLNSLKALRN